MDKRIENDMETELDLGMYKGLPQTNVPKDTIIIFSVVYATHSIPRNVKPECGQLFRPLYCLNLETEALNPAQTYILLPHDADWGFE